MLILKKKYLRWKNQAVGKIKQLEKIFKSKKSIS